MDGFTMYEWDCNWMVLHLCVSSLCRIAVNCHANVAMRCYEYNQKFFAVLLRGLTGFSRTQPPCFPHFLENSVDSWNLFLFGSFCPYWTEKKSSGFGSARHAIANSNHWLTHLSADHPRKLLVKLHTYALRFSANSRYNSATMWSPLLFALLLSLWNVEQTRWANSIVSSVLEPADSKTAWIVTLISPASSHISFASAILSWFLRWWTRVTFSGARVCILHVLIICCGTFFFSIFISAAALEELGPARPEPDGPAFETGGSVTSGSRCLILKRTPLARSWVNMLSRCWRVKFVWRTKPPKFTKPSRTQSMYSSNIFTSLSVRSTKALNCLTSWSWLVLSALMDSRFSHM